MLDPTAVFKGDPNGTTVLDFWRWSGSDLLDNLQRGVLAEFLVAQALGVASSHRAEWAFCDVLYKSWKIEVKSAAYAQSWPQEKASAIIYNIAPQKQAWDPKTGDQEALTPPRRTSDIYVFSLLRRPDGKELRDPNQYKPDPLDLDHWEFSVLDAETLNSERPASQKIALNPLSALLRDSVHGSERISWDALKAAVDRAGQALG